MCGAKARNRNTAGAGVEQMQTEQLWYVGVNGNQEGPLPTSAIVARVQQGTIPEGSFVFTQGMANWTPIRSVPPFSTVFGGGPPVLPPMPGPIAPDVIDWQITGEEMQYVEITLDPGEALLAEAGAFLFMEPGIEMETVFGDGTGRPDESFWDKVVASGSRALTGESIALTMFRNTDQTRRKVSFASPYPGKIVPLDLAQLGGKIICEKDAFLCAVRGVKVGIEFKTDVATALFGGEGFMLQKLEGQGMAFVHAGGCVFSRTLEPGETLRIDTGCIVGFQPSVKYEVKMIKGIANMVFGGEGLFMATLTGPGTVWLQTLPFSRLAGRVYAAAPQTGGRSVGEGSVLGGLGNLAMGNAAPAVPALDAVNVLRGIGRILK
jgi:uncharacterized protein (TIGR00266 family)